MTRVAAVVVDYHAGAVVRDCVRSLRRNGVRDVVVVENGAPGSTNVELAELEVTLVEPRVNLGYGRGVNRGVAFAPPCDFLVVANPDVVVHDGAVDAMVAMLTAHPELGIVGPTILRPDGSIYPSHRVFPNVWLAGAHALLAPVWANNPATRRYRAAHADGTVDWVSGAFFVVRRDVFERIGGFDERYFMFAEDMALCWEIRAAGFGVGVCDDAVVTHIEGVSRARTPRAMILAHHRSALRFEWQTSRGWRRALFPAAAVVLGVRLLVVLAIPRRPSESGA